MTTLNFTHKNRNFEVRRVETIETINANGGAAPWLIGTKVKSHKNILFIDGVSTCLISGNKEEIIDLVEYYGM